MPNFFGSSSKESSMDSTSGQNTALETPAANGNGKHPDEAAAGHDPHPSTKAQLRNLLQIVKSVRAGDFSARFPVSEGPVSEVGEILNDIIELNDEMAKEFIRVSKIVGHEGKMTERASIGSVKGAWADNIESVNSLIGDLVQPTNEVARVITSVAK